MLSQITVHTFTGLSLQTYLPNIARLRMEVFREYPYLRLDNLHYEMQNLRRYTASKEAIAVVVFDGSMLIGASTGIPLEQEAENIQKPFLERTLDPGAFFYFSDSVLLKQYRGRGIGHHFFDLREEYVRGLKRFDFSCFCCLDRPGPAPDDHVPLYDFWRKRGYVYHPELKSTFVWKDVNEENESAKILSFWIKTL